nr:hypothetical protein [Kofleriaceae bacterium]
MFSDDAGLVPSRAQHSRRASPPIPTWPLRASVSSELRLDLRFVAALAPAHEVLWVSGCAAMRRLVVAVASQAQRL